jgi:hypothetical protein
MLLNLLFALSFLSLYLAVWELINVLKSKK